MKVVEGGVTAAKGFLAAGVEAGIKYQNRKDMALVTSTVPCRVAGTFTSNVVKAAPVQWDREIVEKSPFVQAIVVNTGIANAGTGKQGMDCCRAEAEAVGRLLDIGGRAGGLHRRDRKAESTGSDPGGDREAGGGQDGYAGGG